MLRFALGLLTLALLCGSGCDLAKDTKDETQQGAESATGLAEKMSGGTVGSYDEESDE